MYQKTYSSELVTSRGYLLSPEWEKMWDSVRKSFSLHSEQIFIEWLYWARTTPLINPTNNRVCVCSDCNTGVGWTESFTYINARRGLLHLFWWGGALLCLHENSPHSDNIVSMYIAIELTWLQFLHIIHYTLIVAGYSRYSWSLAFSDPTLQRWLNLSIRYWLH